MRSLYLRFVILLVFSIPFVLSAQQNNINPSSVNVNDLSDQQVLRIVKEIDKRGLTENEAVALAQARGMKYQQIKLLRQRMQELKTGGDRSDSISYNRDFSQFEDEYSERAIIDTTKKTKRIFGFSFFNNKNLTFEPNLNIPIPNSYTLGEGDEIIIDVWGASQQRYDIKIDNYGEIIIPGIGPIHIGGLTKLEATKIVLKKLELIYSGLSNESPRTFASVNVGTVSSIVVNVIGEVFAPGSYTLPGTATAFNALYLSGGPNENGSFRKIKVIRDGKVVTTLDVYDFLINGNSSVNVSLRSADIIMIPTYIKRVKIGGEFKRQGLFEAKEEEKVSDLIKYAGGFRSEAYKGRVELYRITEKERKILDVFSKDFEKIIINDGDSISAGMVLERFENKVVIDGAVYRPGNYELVKDLTLSELIEKADGVKDDVFLNRGLITRQRDDYTLENIAFDVGEIVRGENDINLKREDVVTIFSVNDLREFRTVKIFGAVQNPGEIAYENNMTLSDVIAKTGGLTEYASESFIEIARRPDYSEIQKTEDRIVHVYQFSVSRDLKLNGDDAKFILKPFDEVFVRRAPGYRENANVDIMGEVIYAGSYSLKNRKERISDVIKRAGGLSSSAYPYGAMLTRKAVLSQKQIRLREELIKKDTSLNFSDIGFDVIAIDLKKIMENPGSKDDIYMKAGDELAIPREQQTVKVSGEVLNPISATYVSRRKLKFYIDQGGGFGLHAKRRKTYVIYPNGAAAATKRIFLVRRYPKIFPGCEVVVPQKPARVPVGAAGWISMASALASVSLTVVTIMNSIK